MDLSIELRGLGVERTLDQALELHHPNMKAVNTREAPLTVVPATNEKISVDGEKLTARLKPGSWNVIVTTAAKRG
jgi:alpha-N-arabinofuranosidase